MGYSLLRGPGDSWKNPEVKISCQTPFNCLPEYLGDCLANCLLNGLLTCLYTRCIYTSRMPVPPVACTTLGLSSCPTSCPISCLTASPTPCPAPFPSCRHLSVLCMPITASPTVCPTACLTVLKGQCHEIFCFWFFSWISFPPAPEYPIRTVSNFFENSRRYLQV